MRIAFAKKQNKVWVSDALGVWLSDNNYHIFFRKSNVVPTGD